MKQSPATGSDAHSRSPQIEQTSHGARTNARVIITVLPAYPLSVLLTTLMIGWSWRTLIFVSIFTAVIFGLGILQALNPAFRKRFEEISSRAFAAYMLFLGWMVIAFLPPFLMTNANRYIVTFPGTVQGVIIIAWAGLLGFWIWLVATERRRLRTFSWFEKRIGRFSPVAYSFNLLMIAVIFFALITFLSARNRISRPEFSEDKPVTVDSLQDFYLWHFIDAVPILRVNDTIGWKRPFNYEGHLVGWILLLFKLVVIIPVIACFASFWRNFGVLKSASPTGRQWPRTARSAGRHTRRAGGSTYYRRTARGYAQSNH